jgi:hypothetical protein
MSRVICDPSSGSIELCLTEIIRSGSQMFFVCLVGIWQRYFEPRVSVCVFLLMITACPITSNTTCFASIVSS